jgi:hypothetical protein
MTPTKRSRSREVGRLLCAWLAALLLLALKPAVAEAAWVPNTVGSRALAAQDDYPLPPLPPTIDPYAGPGEPTLPLPTLPPPATATPTLRPTNTPASATGPTTPAPLYPTITPTAATPGATLEAPRTPRGGLTATPEASPTLRVRTITPVQGDDEPAAPEATDTPMPLPTPTGAPTPDRAAMLIATAVAREEATLAAPQVVSGPEAGPRYGWFLALAALLLAGIGYATLLRRQRERDRQAYLQEPPEDEGEE